MKFVFRTDVHLADKGPVSWKGDYLGELWSSLTQVADIARDLGACAVLDGGDLFHVKAPTKNSHALVAETVRLHRDVYPCPTYSVVGNHDISYNNHDSLVRQSLGVVFASGAIKPLTSVVFEEHGKRVRVVGVPFIPDRTLDSLLAIQKQPGDDFLVAIVHALASEEPPPSVLDFFGEPVFRYRDLVTPQGPDVFAFGHWHKDQGITELEGKVFVNPGSLSRGSLSFETLTRTPQAVIFDFSGDKPIVTLSPLVVAPAEDVFNFEAKANKEKETRRVTEFLETLQANLARGTGKASVTDTLKGLPVPHRVLLETQRYLEMFGVG